MPDCEGRDKELCVISKSLTVNVLDANVFVWLVVPTSAFRGCDGPLAARLGGVVPSELSGISEKLPRSQFPFVVHVDEVIVYGLQRHLIQRGD